ncbi:unnamed protein product, partial [Brenthis ino]
MRNALVVLVPVCIGLTSGFIVPSSIQEIFEISQNNENFVSLNGVLSEKKLQGDVQLKPTTVTTKRNKIDTTERSANQILDKYLYEYTIQKDVNLTERSFIYIKNKKTKNLKEYLDDNNAEKFSLLNVKNIFDDVHRRLYGHIDKNNFNMQRVFEDSGHCCEGKSRNIVKYNNDIKTKDLDKFQIFFGIPVFLNDLDKYTGDTKDKVKSNSYSDYLIPTNSKDNKSYGANEITQTAGNRKNRTTDKTFSLEVKTPSESESDGNEVLDYLINKNLEDKSPERKNYILQYGFHYCRDCIVEAEKQVLNDRASVKFKCKCGNDQDVKKNRHSQNSYFNNLYNNYSLHM